MVKIEFEKKFEHFFIKLKDNFLKQKIKKQIQKILINPLIGKPMRNFRKGTREVYVSPYRLSYLYLEKEDKIVLLDLYHKKNQ